MIMMENCQAVWPMYRKAELAFMGIAALFSKSLPALGLEDFVNSRKQYVALLSARPMRVFHYFRRKANIDDFLWV